MSEENEILYGRGFLKDVQKLPPPIQDKLADQIEIARKDIFDSRLHTKALSRPLLGKYSLRVTRDWRVGFIFLGPHKVFLLAADNRKRIYKRLGKI